VHPHKIGSPDIFDEYEKVQQSEFISSMLMVHACNEHTSPTALIMFPGSKAALHGNHKQALPLEIIAKSTVMQMALNLSIFKLREDIVYENCRVTTFACDTLI